MKKIILPFNYNYVGVFLTFDCNVECSYCINRDKGSNPKYKQLSSDDWIKGLNRLVLKDDLPITLQGGEPSLHPGFYKIINGIKKESNIDIITNGMFDVKEFMRRVKPDRCRRNAPYASIRVSFHTERMELTGTIERVEALLDGGYSVGVWIVDHPRDTKIVHISQALMLEQGIDCRLKEFLGQFKDKYYGTYLHPKAVDGIPKSCLCKPSELLIAPNGSVHRCHYELYNNVRAYAHILDAHVKPISDFRPCETMGLCNPCDQKLKTDRFQKFGHCSTEIKEISDKIVSGNTNKGQ